MEDLNALIDPTTFGTVRRYLKAAHSPITTVMLVQHRDILPRVGTALVADDDASAPFRRRQWTQWLTSGEVRVGEPADGTGTGPNLEAIPDSAICDVLYLPPIYLVYLRNFRLPAPRNLNA
jgi:hypothetical protein